MSSNKVTMWFLIIMFVLFVGCLLAIRSCNNQKQGKGEIKSGFEIRNAPPAQYTDPSGHNHAVKPMIDERMDALSIIYVRALDSVKKLLKVKDKQIEALTFATTQSIGTVPLHIDTSAGDTKFSYTDPWLDFSGNIDTTTGSLDYKITDSLVFANYWKRKWFLGRKTTFIDAYSLNPSVHVTGLDAANVKVKEPGRFGIGPYLGYGWFGDKWQPSIGISFQYSLIRF